MHFSRYSYLLTAEVVLDSWPWLRATSGNAPARVGGESANCSRKRSVFVRYALETSGGGQAGPAPADLEGEQSLAVTLTGADQQAYFERDLPRSASHLMLRQLVDAGDLSLQQGAEVQIASAASRETDLVLFDLVLRRQGQGLQLVARALDGEDSREVSLPLPKRPAVVEVDWRSSAPGGADGALVLRVRDRKEAVGTWQTLSGLATAGDRAGWLRLGVAAPTEEGVTGTFRIDDFRVWR